MVDIVVPAAITRATEQVFASGGALHGAGPVPTASIWDIVNDQTAQATGAVKVVIGLAALVIILVIFVKARGAVGALIGAGLVAAVALWLVVFGGVDMIAGSVDETIQSAPPSLTQLDRVDAQ